MAPISTDFTHHNSKKKIIDGNIFNNNKCLNLKKKNPKHNNQRPTKMPVALLP